MSETNETRADVFDAEDVVEEKDPNVVYDFEEEIKNREDALNLPKEPKTEEEYRIDENSENVFTNGLNGGKFILGHRCPMCMFTKRQVTELFTKKRFSRNKTVVGYMTVCANCGHVDFYTDDPVGLLKYFRGEAR